MADAPDIFQLADRFRRDLLKRDADVIARLVTSYGHAWRRIREDILLLQRQIDRLQQAGEDTQSRELRKRRLQLLQAQAEEVMTDLFADAATSTTNLQREFARAAESHMHQLAAAQFPDTSGIRVSFARLPESAFAEMVGVLGDGSPLREVLLLRAKEHAEAFGNLLTSGIAQGWGARKLAREARKSFGVPQFEALRIVRTESMRAYNNASVRSMQANADVIKGWIWHAALTTRTCALCVSMHGSFHPVDEPFASHVMCRCSPVPQVRTEGVQERAETGERWFARQRQSTQEAILGKAKTAAYQDGAIKLKDVVGFKRDRRWGPMRFEKSLTDIVGREKAVSFRASPTRGGSSGPVPTNPESAKAHCPNEQLRSD